MTMFTKSGITTIVTLFTVVCIQIGSISCQLNSTFGRWEQIGNRVQNSDYDLNTLDLSNDGTVIILSDRSSANNRASVFKFTVNSATPQWKQLGSDIIEEYYFGDPVVISSDGMTVAVSGFNYDEIRDEATGYVRVLKFNTTSKQWRRVGADIYGDRSDSNWGDAISISADGTIVAIGSPFNSDPDDPFGKDGVVRVYQFNLTAQQWDQLGSEIENEFEQYNDGTISMSADGKTVAIGSDRGYGKSGIVRVYKYSALTRQWNVIGADIEGKISFSPKTLAVNNFGKWISMSADGTTIATTSEFVLDTNKILSPRELHVYIFKFSKVNSTWSQVADIIDYVDYLAFHKMAMSADGKTIAFSTLTYYQARVFTNTYGASWEQVGSNITISVYNNLALSAKGTTLVIGSQRYGFKSTPTRFCDITWNLFNSATERMVTPLINGTVIADPPPCGYTNIEAFVPCAPVDGTIMSMNLELYSVGIAGNLQLKHRRREDGAKFFLFGNSNRRREDVFNGLVPSGTYMIRAIDNNSTLPGPFTKFTLSGTCA